MSHYSAKDKAFDAERAKFRHTCNDLRRDIRREQAKQSELRDEIQELKNKLASKDEWIERLLEYTELSPADIKNRIADENYAAKRGLNSLFGTGSPFARIVDTALQTAAAGKPTVMTLPVPGTAMALTARTTKDAINRDCVCIALESDTPGQHFAQDIVRITPDTECCEVLLRENLHDRFYTRKVRIAVDK